MMSAAMADDDHDDAPPVAGGAGGAGGAGDPGPVPPAPPPDRDPMGPPAEPCECWCMHCHRTFMSDGIWFQRVIGDPDGFEGFWMCPTPNCGGAGFTFDIFPTDPDHPANDGWHSTDDEDDGDADEGAEGPGANLDEGEWQDDDDDGEGEDAAEWDPDEAKYKALDEALGDPDDDDVEGEEWKHGLAPGERPPPRAPASWPEDERRQWEAEQRRYDEPDRRPRELDWSDRPPRPRPKPGEIAEDDIPF
jgi:hypothetical protein